MVENCKIGGWIFNNYMFRSDLVLTYVPRDILTLPLLTTSSLASVSPFPVRLSTPLNLFSATIY